MLLPSRMNRLALLLCFLSLAANAQGSAAAQTPETSGKDATTPPPAAQEAPPSPPPEDPCLAEADDESDSEVLGALRLSVNGENRALADVKLEGLQRLPEPMVRALAHVPEKGPLSPEQAALLLERLAGTGLFTQVTPTVRLAEGSTPVLVVALEEQPHVSSVDITGLQKDEQRDVQDQLFRLPPYGASHEDGDDDEEDEDEDEDDTVANVRIGKGGIQVHISSRECLDPDPPKELLAFFDEEGRFHPGIVWKGLPEALERAQDELEDEGYLLASLDATLTPEGQLRLRVDEGKVEAVEVRGVDEDVAARVREVMGIKPGDVLLRSDLSRAESRLEQEMPFLELWEVEEPSRPATRFEEVREEGGGRSYRPVEEETRSKKKHKHWEDEVELSWDTLAEGWKHESGDEAITTVGRRVVVHARPRGSSFNAELIPMHTQVTGFAPGLSGSLKLWDVRNRAHVTLDGALTIPLRWGGQRILGDPERTAFQRRLNWLVGAKVEVPAVRLAEVGVQLYDFTDTNDRWRMGAIDSYIYSALLNRPDAEYFRRKGLTGFATWRFSPQWRVGAEYRRDTYDSLVSFSPPFSLFRRDSAPFPNPLVDEGRMTSVVGRIEYASDEKRAERTGPLFRNPELSLVRHDWEWPERTAVRSLLTMEVGSPALGGGAEYRFWKVVSDSVLYVHTGHDDGLRLRVRAAGGEDLPLQKQEALGGWSALRGYAFKEFRGDASLLASAEYRWDFIGVFADVGTVHRKELGWMDPKLGLGAQLYFGDSVHLSVAWRTDERASISPEARLLFVRPF
ncbi:hypothetical protein ATI61_112110 [Archangium gephyra]|uniref:Uncharacterized protein n=1 Tax=Archangium gephyra TaxID=48 RepID=A0AAC8Q5S8_9BACT|nr:hypothetical protein [Archangium gephyra]AKJ00848.1 Hypothetical protein AA314_02474 [Archangium gephyra]REG26015.1 hypothetical protein ATI61_112110 [Archangium gephyra]